MNRLTLDTWRDAKGLEVYDAAPANADRVEPQDLADVVKRFVDLCAAVIGLIVLVPLLALMAFATRLTSPGPALFWQERIGRDGVPFKMLKFRTMVDGAHQLRASLDPLNETAGVFKLRDDPRVTWFGRWLRRASLDELPQLVNVLRGEMSLVGPRPLIAEEDRLVSGVYRERLRVRPGMTGPWQALGAIRPPLREMVVMDCLYVENWSLPNDFKILLRTALQVVRLRGL